MPISLHHRLLSAAGAVGIVALMFYLLLAGLPGAVRDRPAPSLTVLQLQLPHARPRVRPEPRTPTHKRYAASAANLRAQASPVIAAPAGLPTPIVAALQPGAGSAVSTGESDLPGPGIGGAGDATGQGGSGDGDGDGFQPPLLLKGRIKPSDLPRSLAAVRLAANVAVRYDVGTDGRPGNCSVTRSSGYVELDQLTCRLIAERFRFAPSRDPQGNALSSSIEEDHRWSNTPPVGPPPPAPDGLDR